MRPQITQYMVPSSGLSRRDISTCHVGSRYALFVRNVVGCGVVVVSFFVKNYLRKIIYETKEKTICRAMCCDQLWCSKQNLIKQIESSHIS